MTIEQPEPACVDVADAIVEEIEIAAPVARVWRALTDAAEFGQWFGATISAPFREGETVEAHLTLRGKDYVVQMNVQALEAPDRFVYTWHPYALDPAIDYSQEPETVVEFRLAARDTGTLLTVRESGFDAIPAFRRAEAFRMNTSGWSYQLANIGRHASERP
ncbi:SRPBCC family protein [Acuticoccus sp. MNP-M23]|uniref:SRPBCC family protein n=1 Tax=Acuticoccus sp. MNP-M23 TaxID=3072793 RepID=UPI0028161B03|nr:SRPBCC family protein [Acuticoccus sp. MNP-M23]WMS44055.1 SRPBCC family protein [Acuticoccus sp. MNP-M23]